MTEGLKITEEDAHARGDKIVSVMEGLSIEDKLHLLQGVTYSIVLRQPNPDTWMKAYCEKLKRQWPEMKAMAQYLRPSR